jgi:hypothetical protein
VEHAESGGGGQVGEQEGGVLHEERELEEGRTFTYHVLGDPSTIIKLEGGLANE